MVKFAKDKNVIPVLQEIVKHPGPDVRLQAAGSLIVIGDADTALPVLDELAEEEGYSSALYYLFSKPGKIIDERGYAIVEKALNNQKAEVRIHAVNLLLESKKIPKEKAEEMALKILEELKNKTIKDYGLMAINPKESIRVKQLPGLNIDVEQANQLHSSDSRACDYTISIVTELKSRKALNTLKHIGIQNTEWWYVCKRGVKEALESIEKNGDIK